MCIKKFIVARGQVFFGREFVAAGAYEPAHRDIAKENNIDFSEVTGGGLAWPEYKEVFENSYEFGPYDQAEVQKLLPDWNVDKPRPGEPHPGG